MVNIEEQPEDDSISYDADVARKIMNCTGLDQCEGKFSTERIVDRWTMTRTEP